MNDIGHDCVYGVGPDYDGGLLWYNEKSVKHLNSMKDVEFSFCPICGKNLEVAKKKDN